MSNSFGFNMGVKMGDFGFVKAVGTPTPPPVTPQPQYIVAVAQIYDEEDIESITTQINTSNVSIDYAENTMIDGKKVTRVYFTGNLAQNPSNIYMEGRFQRWYTTESPNPIPTFTIAPSGSNSIDITAINYDTTTVWAGYDGQFSLFMLTIIIFEE